MGIDPSGHFYLNFCSGHISVSFASGAHGGDGWHIGGGKYEDAGYGTTRSPAKELIHKQVFYNFNEKLLNQYPTIKKDNFSEDKEYLSEEDKAYLNNEEFNYIRENIFDAKLAKNYIDSKLVWFLSGLNKNKTLESIEKLRILEVTIGTPIPVQWSRTIDIIKTKQKNPE